MSGVMRKASRGIAAVLLLVPLLTLLSTFMACGTPAPREPEWRGAGRALLADYIRLRLEGNPAAVRAYLAAQERMRDGGDLDGLHTVLLARCALDVALLVAADCGDFARRSLAARSEALAYHHFITGTLPAGEIAALPERYRAFAQALAANSTLAPVVAAIPDPVSRMIATGVASRGGRADDSLLAASSALAREQGWRAAHRAHEAARALWLDAHGRGAEATAIRARLRALYAGDSDRAAP